MTRDRLADHNPDPRTPCTIHHDLDSVILSLTCTYTVKCNL